MKKIKILFLFSFCFLIFTCDDNSVNPLDQKLQHDIIGTWRNNLNQTITFFPDGSFMDTTKFENFDSLSQIYSYFVRRGRYIIDNSVLYLKEFYFDTVITNSNQGIYLNSRPVLISISNSVMKRKFFDEFENIGRWGNDIWSTWESNGYYCSVETHPFGIPKKNYGTYTTIYKFTKDSSKCLLNYTVYNKANDSTYNHKSLRDFKYTPPYLYIPPGSEYPAEVNFRKNKMYWDYNFQAVDLVKVK